MFGLKSCKSTKLDFYILFGSYMKLKIEFRCDSNWDEN